MENLLAAWREFVRGKRKKKDVQEFQHRLMDNILALHRDLTAGTYKHGPYQHFRISDPKPRDIHKATVRDRLVHHAIYRQLYPFFDKTFIADSYSCRRGKGTHKAMNRFRESAYKASKNHTRTCWVLKCDIRFDRFVKQKLKAKYYIRYADDFVILEPARRRLAGMAPCIEEFLSMRLNLNLHPDKVSIHTFASGLDFLGWVHFHDHRVLRAATKRRMCKRVRGLEEDDPTVRSYLGMLSHENTFQLAAKIDRIQ